MLITKLIPSDGPPSPTRSVRELTPEAAFRELEMLGADAVLLDIRADAASTTDEQV